MLKNKNNFILIFLFLTSIVFIVFRNSLRLSLYGDDWLVISKYLGGYGPGKEFSYFDSRVWINNYGFQNLPGLIYVLFKSNPLPYFIINLLFRSLTALGIYIFIKKTLNFKSALLGSIYYALNGIGSETTDWVYNMNTYLGIFIALIGLSFFVSKGRNIKHFKGLLLIILGYVIVPIRLFVMSPLLLIIEFLKQSGKIFNRSFKAILITGTPFIILKIFYPYLGWQPVNTSLITEGIRLAKSLIITKRFDFFLYPITSIGQMLVPLNLDFLNNINWSIDPFRNFIFYGIFLVIVGTLVLKLFLNKNKGNNLLNSLAINSLLLFALRTFIKKQLSGQLTSFANFFWTYIGILFLIILFFIFVKVNNLKDKIKLIYFLLGTAFLVSFLFPWAYNPSTIFQFQHRYLALSAVGVSFLLAGTSYFVFKEKEHLRSYLIIFVVLVLIQINSVNHFFLHQLNGRTNELNNKIFSQIMAEVPKLPKQESIFYFENFPPLVYEQLLRFGFGYHMQLLYDIKFDEQRHPFSVQNKTDLISAYLDSLFLKRLGYLNLLKIDNLFAFKYNNGYIVNITDETRLSITKVIDSNVKK